MTESLLIGDNRIGKMADTEMENLINILWDQDMDMGVDRILYDPVLREQQIKKQEAEQARLLELKKKQAQQHMMLFTIDEETGERIPKPSAGPYQPPAEFTDDSDLSKELAELIDIANLDKFFGDGDAVNNGDNTVNNDYMNTNTQPQQMVNNNYNMIIHNQEQQAPEVDMWATQITMLPGPSYDNVSDMGMPSPTDNDNMFMSVWDVDNTKNTNNTGLFNMYNESPEVAYQSTSTAEYAAMQATPSPTSASYYNAANGQHSDSGVSMQSSFLDAFASDSSCTYSSHGFDEDIKPQIQAFNNGFSPSMKGSNSKDSKSSSESENGDFGGMTKSEQEKERRNACRDEQRCRELKIPFDVETITNYPVEDFNALLRQHQLTEEQLTLVKDIRRRGKNKVAAQNCRKKKMNELTGLEEEINDLKRKRNDLVRDKDDAKRSRLHLQTQLDQTYAEVFSSIRDHLGRPYDPRFYSLHISDDGDARIIPNKVSTYARLNYHLTA